MVPHVRRAITVLVIALFFCIVGPLLTSPRGKAAGTTFAYEPPEEFKTADSLGLAPDPNAKVWAYDDPNAPSTRGGAPPPTIVLTHTDKQMSVEERDLAKLVEEMPSVFENCHWVHRRHELRIRTDGARVGIIEGDCDRQIDLSNLGLPPKTIKQRKLQLAFPDDSGTSLVTASYPSEQGTRWEPVLEATIAKAKGVATRVPSPPDWMYAAWAAAGLVIGWLASALLAKKQA